MFATTTMIGCAGSAGSTLSSGLAKPNAARVHAQAQVTPPAVGVFLGAQVNPDDDRPLTPTEIIQQTQKLESSMGRKLALHLHYNDWQSMSTISQDTSVQDDLKNGRMPIFSWTCADNIVQKPPAPHPYNLVDIANGKADNDLALIANQLLAEIPRRHFVSGDAAILLGI